MTNTSPGTLSAAFIRLWGHVSSRRRFQLGLVLALTIVGALAEMVTIGSLVPFLTLLSAPGKADTSTGFRAVYELLGWGKGEDILLPAAALFACAALAAGALRLLMIAARALILARVGHDLATELQSRILYQPYPWQIAHNSSELIAGMGKLDGIVYGVLGALLQGFTACVIIAFVFGALLLIDPFATLIAFGGLGGAYAGLSALSRRRLYRNSAVIASAQNHRIKALQEGLGAIRDILLDRLQPVYLARFRRVDAPLRRARSHNDIIGQSPRFLIETIGIIFFAFLAVGLARQSGGINTALPILGALALGAQRMLPLLQQLYGAWALVQGNHKVVLDVDALLSLPRSASVKVIAPLPFDRAIVCNSLSFGYGENRPFVLREIDLEILQGSRVGIIGATGSGKSTLLDVLMGLLSPSAGTISIDGVPLDDMTRLAWQARIAHVPQAIYLADTTIAENIALGVDAAAIDHDRVHRAASQAQLDAFVRTLDDGYDTIIGERGVRLSGGQRQRVGIARALYKRASVLVLDEATSALDTGTESAVMDAVRHLDPELTVLIIAHRLSTVADCDMVIKLDAGRIVARGSPSEVIGSPPPTLVSSG